MSTPIETNTEQLQEVLQQVYNLPSRSGGSSEPDLVITTGENFSFLYIENAPERSPRNVVYETEKIISTYEKLKNGGDVRVTFGGQLWLNSWDGGFYTTYPAQRVAASIDRDAPILIARFLIPVFWDGSGIGTYVTIEYIFTVDTTNRTAELDAACVWNHAQ